MPPRALKPDSVHVWQVGLDDLSAAGPLSPDERARAETLRDPLRRRRYVATRSAVRTLLGRYAACPPEALAFATTRHGKPFLPGRPELAFNLSHSGPHLVVAVSPGVPVGIDLEVRVMPAPLAVGRSVFSAGEQRFLEGLDEPACSDAFYRLWVRKEALLKGRGDGFAADPKEITVLEPTPIPGWYLHDLAEIAGCAGALATPIERVDIQYFPAS